MTLQDVLNNAANIMREAIHEELHNQGHYLTGALEASIKGVVKLNAQGGTLTGTALYYAQILDQGVSAARVPYNRGSGAGHSSYIDALIRYFQLRGFDEKAAKAIAFATANKQKAEGMPTTSSSKYSRTGTRLGFLQQTNEHLGTKLDDAIFSGIDKMVDEVYNETKSERI